MKNGEVICFYCKHPGYSKLERLFGKNKCISECRNRYYRKNFKCMREKKKESNNIFNIFDKIFKA